MAAQPSRNSLSIRCASICVSTLKAVLILKWMREKFAKFCIFFLGKLWHISVFFCYLNHVVERLSIKWGKITLRDPWRCRQQVWASACSRSCNLSKRKESGKRSKTVTAQMSQNFPLKRAGVLQNKIGLSCFQSQTSPEPVYYSCHLDHWQSFQGRLGMWGNV